MKKRIHDLKISDCSYIVRKENKHLYFKNILILNTYINRGRPVPSVVFQKLLSYIENIEDDTSFYQNRIPVIKKGLKEFISHPRMKCEFEFKKAVDTFGIKNKEDNTPSRIVKDCHMKRYNFKNLIDHVLYSAKDHYRIYEKKDFTMECYRLIKQYVKKDKRVKNQYTHYKIGALIGYISFHLNYKLSPSLSKRRILNEMPSASECFAYIADDIRFFK